ncbi:hypothetical protein RYD26_12170 [Pasteurellaceae bacterium LIM206]|nr:hypothetical protein [Pasteurellaceae bacterium LIM206]
MKIELGFNLPELYSRFLLEIENIPNFVIEGTGITLYSKTDLIERNCTYQVEEYEPDFFLIGQDGDLAFFIKKDSSDTIYANDLGALGSLKMRVISSDIYEFIEYAANHYDEL